jgi:sugar phosphate isomerase/epimerase
VDRRRFLGALSSAAAALGLGSRPARAWARRARASTDRIDAIGIQLYTVRSLMGDDVEGTLAALAGIGYREVEFAGLHGRSASEMRALLDDLGVRAVSSHHSLQEVTESLPRLLEDASTLGQTYLVVPYLDAGDRTADGYRRAADAFNAAGAMARAAGIRFGYHNHDFEFAPLDGTTGFDLLLERTDPQLVTFELDVYWMVNGGRDPLAYFEAHPGRFELLHLKDRTADGRMVDVGAGAIDFAAVLERGERSGVEHGFVEHDQPPDPLASARNSFGHLSGLAR